MNRARHRPRPRSARAADLPGLLALERACFGPRDGGFTPRQMRALLRNPRAIWLITPQGQAAACWLACGNGHSRWARLYSLAVHPEARGRGLAGQLLSAGLRRLHRLGLNRCRAEVQTGNARARRLYARFGFREVGHLPDYYAPGVHGLRLSAELPPERTG